MGARISRFLSAPVFDDEEKTRVAELVNAMLLVSLLGALLFPLFSLSARLAETRILINALALAMGLCVIGLRYLLHRGHLRLAAILLTAAVWVSFTLAIYSFDGIGDTAVAGCYLAVLITSLVLSRRALVLVDVVASLSILLVYELEVRGLLVTTQAIPPSPADLVTVLFTLNGTALLAAFAVRKLASGDHRLRDERDRAQRHLDIAGAIIVACDVDGRVTLVNRKGCEVLGREEAGIIGQPWLETFVPEAARPEITATLAALTMCQGEAAVHIESPILNGAGMERIVAWNHNALKGGAGDCVGILSSGEDVTEHRQVTRALSESHERLLTILDSIDADVYVADLNTYEIMFMNRHIRAGFGEDMVGRVCYEVFREGSEVCSHCTNPQLVDVDGSPSGAVTWESFNPVTERWYINQDRAIRWVDGRLVRLQVATDISDHKLAEAARVRTQGFLLALSQAAPAVQSARSPEAAYRAIGDQIARLGMDAFVLTVREDRASFDLVYAASRPEAVGPVEDQIGLPEVSPPISMTSAPMLCRVVEDAQTIFDPLTDDTQAGGSEALTSHAEPSLKLLGQYPRIAAPLVIGGDVQALLVITGSALSETDVPAVAAFANQAAIAIENARLYRETQQLAAFNERLLVSMAEGLIVQGGTGEVTFANPAAAGLLGYSVDELLRLHWTEYTPLDQWAVIQSADGRRMHGEADRYEVDLIRKDGQRITVLVSGSPLFDDDGQVVGTTAIFTDVTERSQTQRALQVSERRFRELFQGIPACCFTVDRDGIIGEWNRACQMLYGWTAQEAIGTSMYDLMVRPANVAATRRNFAAVFDGQSFEGMEFEDVRADGSACIVLANEYSLRDSEDRVISAICAELDITERKRAEEQLSRLAEQIQAQAREMEQVLATVPAGVLLLTAEGRIVRANPVAEEVLLALAGTEAGGVFRALGDHSLSELKSSPATSGLWHEVSGDGRVFEAIARPVQRGAAPGNWVLVFNDVTEERRIQDELHQQERLAVVGQLAAGIAHDFNNILATIVLYAQMASGAPELSAHTRERLDVITSQAWDATRLIQQVLDFSRRSVLERQSLDLVPLLKEQVKLLERMLPEHIRLELVSGEGDYAVDADPTRIRQMLANLALNARDAMPDGGILRVELGRVGPTPDQPTAREWIRLKVSDTGIGIAPEALPHVFEPFYTTKSPGKGSGLGLAQVHGIVGQHGGRIEVVSQVKVGTTFTIDLPALSTSPTPLTPSESSEALALGQGGTILVVEDNRPLREALLDIVAQLNYRVLAAANGREALRVLDDHPEIGLVLSDYVMPEMGGQALFRALAERRSHVPMVILTGHPMERELELLKSEGLVGWMLKPPDVEQLSHLLAYALRTGEE